MLTPNPQHHRAQVLGYTSDERLPRESDTRLPTLFFHRHGALRLFDINLSQYTSLLSYHTVV